MRRIFVGDIQGCLEQMESLLAAVAYGLGDILYCVGDLVNRGPDSLGVLRRVRSLDARVVLGNHDLKLLRIGAGIAAPSRADRLQAILAAPDRDALLDWLAAQPVLRVEPDVVVVHGGLDPTWADLPRVAAEINASIAAHVRGRPDPRIEFATEVRYCDATGRRAAEDHPPPRHRPSSPGTDFYTRLAHRRLRPLGAARSGRAAAPARTGHRLRLRRRPHRLDRRGGPHRASPRLESVKRKGVVLLGGYAVSRRAGLGRNSQPPNLLTPY